MKHSPRKGPGFPTSIRLHDPQAKQLAWIRKFLLHSTRQYAIEWAITHVWVNYVAPQMNAAQRDGLPKLEATPPFIPKGGAR